MAYAYRGFRRQWGEQRACGGALMWQLNDCWPCTSWSIADYFLRKKPAFYTITRALQPIVVGVQREHHDWSVCHARPAKTSAYKVWVASSLTTATEVDVELRFISISSGKDIQKPMVQKRFNVQANGTSVVLSGIIDNKTMEPHVLFARIWREGAPSPAATSQDVDWPQPLKYLDFPERNVRIQKLDSAYVVTADRPTKGLVIEEQDNVVLSDNCIDVMPGDQLTVRTSGDAEESPRFRYLGSEDLTT
jgi:beta-mannosidase